MNAVFRLQPIKHNNVVVPLPRGGARCKNDDFKKCEYNSKFVLLSSLYNLFYGEA